MASRSSAKRARVEEELASSTTKVTKIDLAGFVSIPITLQDISQSGKSTKKHYIILKSTLFQVTSFLYAECVRRRFINGICSCITYDYTSSSFRTHVHCVGVALKC